MTSYYQDLHNTIYNVDFRQNELPDESVQMVCTSPPYWGLRKYSGEQELIWRAYRGESCAAFGDCEHEWGQALSVTKGGTGQQKGLKGNTHIAETWDDSQTLNQGNFCSLCGAWKGAFGLEPTPELYLEHTIEILREIRRVLRKDGVVFWNIGDSYVGGKGQSGVKSQEYQDERVSRGISLNRVQQTGGPGETRSLDDLKSLRASNLKPKDLCLIPFRVAIAAQEDGWWVRSVIVWSKPNPMPESVRDRPTTSHEYILMLTKSGTSQYWTHRDHAGTRTQPKPDYRWIKEGIEVNEMPEGWTPKNKMDWNRVNLWTGHDYYWDADAVREPYNPASLNRYDYALQDTCNTYGQHKPGFVEKEKTTKVRPPNPSGRNIRSVWNFPTTPFAKAHFAVFPEKLPELCIKAATPEVGCCSKCGAPWERITESKQYPRHDTEARDLAVAGNGAQRGKHAIPTESKTLGWQPTCKCNDDKVPSTVLDPFMGAGTTLWVAKKLNRKAVGYEISEEYCDLTVERIRQQVML